MNAKKSLEPGHDPGIEPGEIKLTDIVDLAQIQSLIEVLSQTMGTAAGLLDLEGNILAASGWQRIFTDFHEVHPQAHKACIESFARLSSGLERGKPILYKCWNNLWDIATPVFVEGRRVGNLFIGQCFLEDEEPDIEVFKNQARKYGFDEKEYLDALAEVPRISREKAEWAMALFVKIADHVSELGARNLQLARALEMNKTLLESLAASESLMRIAGDLVALGGWQYYVGEDRFSYSEKVAEIHEVPIDFEPTLEEVIEFCAPEYRRRIRKVFKNCLKKGDPFDEEVLIVTGSGRRVWVRTVGTPIRDEAGRVTRIHGAFQDISGRKKAEEALRQGASQFRAFVEGAPDGIFVQLNGRIAFFNETAGRLLKAGSVQELLGRKVVEFFSPGQTETIRRRLKRLNEEKKIRPSAGDPAAMRGRLGSPRRNIGRAFYLQRRSGFPRLYPRHNPTEKDRGGPEAERGTLQEHLRERDHRHLQDHPRRQGPHGEPCVGGHARLFLFRGTGLEEPQRGRF